MTKKEKQEKKYHNDFKKLADAIMNSSKNCYPRELFIIDKFRGKHWFLSNFYPGDKTSLEHKFQLSKVNIRKKDHNKWIEKIGNAEAPREARRLGKYKLPKELIWFDWETRKVKVMLDLLFEKFSHKKLKKKLLKTGNAQLIEGNSWGDKFWGVDEETGEGSNILGRLLMIVREVYRS